MIEWLSENWMALALVLLTVAGFVARFTKTTVDDEVVSWLRRLLGGASSVALGAPRPAKEEPLLRERTEGEGRPKVTRLDL